MGSDNMMTDFIDKLIEESRLGPISSDLEMAISYLITAQLKLERGTDNKLTDQIGIVLQTTIGVFEATLKEGR